MNVRKNSLFVNTLLRMKICNFELQSFFPFILLKLYGTVIYKLQTSDNFAFATTIFSSRLVL